LQNWLGWRRLVVAGALFTNLLAWQNLSLKNGDPPFY